MSTISFNGLGSGLQVSEIVTALVEAESTPFYGRMNSRESSVTTDISAAGALKSALEAVQGTLEGLGDDDQYQKRTASGSDDFVSFSAEKEASIGSYDVKVNQLAQQHKLSSGAIDADAAVGEGTLNFAVGEANFDIEVGSGDTLEDIKNAINEHADNTSVTATIINGDGGQHLVLTANDTGEDNEIVITATDTDGNNTDAAGLSQLAYDANNATPVTNMNEVRSAQNAQITIDGSLTVSSQSNTFTNAIDGTTITAKKVHDADDSDSALTVKENNSNIANGLSAFVKSYNELLDLANQLGSSSDAGAGPMAGDSLLRGVMSKLRQQITQPVDMGDGQTLSLSALGVETDRYGKLSLNSETLNEKIDENVNLVQSFLVGEDSDSESGFVQSLDGLLNLYTDSDGLIQNRLDSKENALERINDDREAFARKMQSMEDRLYAQYNAMDLLVAEMNATSDYVQAQLANLPGVVKKSSD